MSQQITDIKISFQLVDCKCTDFHLTEFAKNNKEPIPVGNSQYVISTGFEVNETKDLIIVKINSIALDNPIDKNELFSITSTYDFKFIEADKVFIKNGAITSVPNALLVTLYSIALSTHRGMNIIKLENTIYSDIFLPIIDANQFIATQNYSLG